MAETKKPTARTTTTQQFKELKTLINTVKQDNLVQFGEIKKDFGTVAGTLTNHESRITALEKDKIERDAIEQYKKDHPELAQKIFDTGQKAYNEQDTSTIGINKELVKAVGYLVIALGVVAMALYATKK